MASAGVSTKSLAEATGIPRTTLARRLTGNSPWTLEELDLLAQHFDTTPLALVEVAA
jgi:plasmid maintenance system antidote protein VapI